MEFCNIGLESLSASVYTVYNKNEDKVDLEKNSGEFLFLFI